MLYTVAGSLLAAGTGFVLESNFRRGISDGELGPLVERSRAVFVHCTVPDAERRRRYAERVRHPGHFDAALLAAWEADTALFGPPDLADLTVVDIDGAAPSDTSVAQVMRALPR